jgi:hypothetical protein
MINLGYEMIRNPKKLYIECVTCKHTINCDRNRSRKCLKTKVGLTEKTINGKKWTSLMNYKYVLWEPMINNFLEDDLFEI